MGSVARKRKRAAIPTGPVVPATRPIWHYTTGARFGRILCDGVIKPATAYVAKGETPAVWFSMNQDWEQTANKSIGCSDGTVRRGDRADTESVGGGLVRIAVAPETAPHDWTAYRRLSGIPPHHADGLEAVARADGADPADWRASFLSVPRAKWLAVEVWMGYGWDAISLE